MGVKASVIASYGLTGVNADWTGLFGVFPDPKRVKSLHTRKGLISPVGQSLQGLQTFDPVSELREFLL